MDTRIVTINGTEFRIPADELTDPHPNLAGGSCPWFDTATDAVCTLGTSGPEHGGTAHIAHDGDGYVIAIWDDSHGYQLGVRS